MALKPSGAFYSRNITCSAISICLSTGPAGSVQAVRLLDGTFLSPLRNCCFFHPLYTHACQEIHTISPHQKGGGGGDRQIALPAVYFVVQLIVGAVSIPRSVLSFQRQGLLFIAFQGNTRKDVDSMFVELKKHPQISYKDQLSCHLYESYVPHHGTGMKFCATYLRIIDC